MIDWCKAAYPQYTYVFLFRKLIIAKETSSGGFIFLFFEVLFKADNKYKK
jgi:hypothetical protein